MLIRNLRIPITSIIFVGFLPSFLKVFYYRLIGYKIGKNVKFGFGSVINGKSICIGNGTRIGFFSIISCEDCIVEENVEIGSFVYMKVNKIHIGFQTVIRENNLFGGMEIGKSVLSIGYMSHIHQKCLINTTLPIRIGNNTAIGGGSYLFTHSSWQSILEGYPCTFAPIKIGDNVWISWNVFILPDVKIGSGTLVAAGAVVTKNLPDKCLASGNPAKPIIPSGMFPRELYPDEKATIIESIIKSFGDYILKNGLSIKENIFGGFIKYTIIDSKHKVYNLFFIKKNEAILHSKIDFPKNSVLLLNYDIDYVQCNFVKDKKIFIIDLKNRTSHGKNKLGNEVVKFLKHYGIRLKIV